MTEDKQKQNARLLLFADFGIDLKKAKDFIDDMEEQPEKSARYFQLLSKNISEQYETIKKKNQEELMSMAKERTKKWNDMIGPVTIHEFVTMSNQWDIPVDGLIDRKITPELIKEMLDYFVMGQEDYKINLSVAFYTYLMHRRRAGLFLPKSNLLVCGPSGSGKTYGMQMLSKLFHVPFLSIHCNTLVQEGIKGPRLTDGFTQLLSQGWTKEDIEHAVVCFDEFDKLFERRRDGSDSGCYNARVVNEMLNIIDDRGEVEFMKSLDDNQGEHIKLPTRKMMFVFTGVFDGLVDKKKQSVSGSGRASMREIGFLAKRGGQATNSIPAVDEEPSDEDFIEFGVKPEILGRIQNFVFLNELTEDELMALFDMGVFSPFREYEQYFSYNGINAILTDEGKRTLARIAHQRKLGVRGLSGLLKKVLTEDMYDLDVGEDNVLKITEEYINNNLNND